MSGKTAFQPGECWSKIDGFCIAATSYFKPVSVDFDIILS